jgi:hypothetical protein
MIERRCVSSGLSSLPSSVLPKLATSSRRIFDAVNVVFFFYGGQRRAIVASSVPTAQRSVRTLQFQTGVTTRNCQAFDFGAA